MTSALWSAGYWFARCGDLTLADEGAREFGCENFRGRCLHCPEIGGFEMFLKMPIEYVLVYLVVINLVGFLVMWWDKRQARLGNWRTPEKTLFLITFLGGGFGTMAGMYKFRHKTKKLRFTIGFPTILITEICLVIYLAVKGDEMIKQILNI